MNLLVCGGRDYSNWPQLETVLSAIHMVKPVSLLIHGAARGADELAGKWATIWGIPVDPHPADWKRHGRSAGMRRNVEMLGSKPELVVAFPGGKGTANMVELARKLKVRTVELCGLCLSQPIPSHRASGCSCMHAPCVHDLIR